MRTLTPQQGEIWLVRFDPTRGAEIQKTRPALVVGANDVGNLALHIVVPITGWDAAYVNFPWFVSLMPNSSNGLTKPSGADAFQVKSVSKERFVNRVGKITRKEFMQVLRAIALCLEPGDDLDE